MKIEATHINGVFIIDPMPLEDERGFFARTWCQDEFAALGISFNIVQSSISYNRKRGTLRGLHLQAPPHGEHKLVRCIRGSLFDVAVDLRPESPTYKRWVGLELSSENRKTLYIAPGIAHGLQTLVDDVEVSYQISERYHPPSVRGFRWDDPSFGVEWPRCENRIMSPRDAAFPDYDQ